MGDKSRLLAKYLVNIKNIVPKGIVTPAGLKKYGRTAGKKRGGWDEYRVSHKHRLDIYEFSDINSLISDATIFLSTVAYQDVPYIDTANGFGTKGAIWDVSENTQYEEELAKYIDKQCKKHGLNDLCLGKQEDHNKVDLSQLSQVEIEIFSYCNRRCWFCPNSYVIDRHSSNILLPDEMYDRLLCDLELIEFSGRLALMRYCEPTSYRDIFLERLAQAREKVVGAELHINTNGDFLNKDYIREMYDAGLRSLYIQCYLSKNDDFDIDDIQRKIVTAANKFELEYEFYEISPASVYAELVYRDMLIAMFAKDFKVHGTNRGGTIHIINEPSRRRSCARPFMSLEVDHKGNVLPCCNMLSETHADFVYGNIAHASALEIFNNDKAIWLRNEVNKDNINLYPCCDCNY